MNIVKIATLHKLKTNSSVYSILDLLRTVKARTFVFTGIAFISCLLYVSLVNSVTAQEQESTSFSNSFNNSNQSSSFTAIPKDQLSETNILSVSSELSSLYPQIKKSTVSIIGTFYELPETGESPSDLENSSNNLNNISEYVGTGFIYDTQGHILTSYGVFNSSQIKQVEFTDGTIYNATVIGSNPYSDIAVLQVEAIAENKLDPIEFINNSSNVLVGEYVATIGDPFGIKGLLSDGIVSGIHQSFSPDQLSYDESASTFSLIDTIVSTVPTNPGSAGGPLFNMKGQVIGMNSAVYSSSGEFSGISIAIPSDTIKREIPQIISTGTYKHPWLGISGNSLTPDIASVIGLNNTNMKGVLVVSVSPGSPADLAGIREGMPENTYSDFDTIIGIDAKPVNKIEDILDFVNSKSVGDTITLKILRNGVIQNASLTLTERP